VGAFKANHGTSVGPSIARKYRGAAETIADRVGGDLEAALGCKNVSAGSTGGESVIYEGEAEAIGSEVGRQNGEVWNLWSDGTLAATVEVPSDGSYRISARAGGTSADGTPPEMAFVVDGKAIDRVDVEASKASPESHVVSTDLSAGDHQIGVRFTNDYHDGQTGDDRNLYVDRLKVAAPNSTDSSEKKQCGDSPIMEFARRAWRRPLTDGEQERIRSLYRQGKEKFDHQTGIGMVIQALLQSPKFVYRFQRTDGAEASDNEAVPLDDFAMASRLSYFLWDSMPDEQLREAARNGELTTEEGLERHARRMLEDPRARRALNRAVLSMLGLRNFESDDDHAGHLDRSTREAMKRETLAFIDHVIWEGDGRLETLLTAPYSFVTEKSAELYDVEAPAGEGHRRVEFEKGQKRSGLLTQPAVLARYGSGAEVIHRGLFVLDTFLCTTLPPPPDEFENPPERKDGESARSQAHDRMEHQQCGTCHSTIDPVGITFENFDRSGRYQETDQHGNSLSSEGGLRNVGEASGAVSGPRQLGKRLANSEKVRTCFARQWMKRGLAQAPSSENSCAVRQTAKALEASEGSIKEMFVELVTSRPFRYEPRSPE